MAMPLRTLSDTFPCICLFCERRFRSKDGPLEDLCPRCARAQAREAALAAQLLTLREVLPVRFGDRTKERIGMSWNEDV